MTNQEDHAIDMENAIIKDHNIKLKVENSLLKAKNDELQKENESLKREIRIKEAQHKAELEELKEYFIKQSIIKEKVRETVNDDLTFTY